MSIYSLFQEKIKQGNKQIAVLIDPDKTSDGQLDELIMRSIEAKVDYLFVGGSLLSNSELPNVVKKLKSGCNIPVILFPGDNLHVDSNADALLFLSLISGRNADLLIGKHVSAAPMIREKKLEAIPTGYMLIESGTMTAALYMSNTHPIPHEKSEIASSTALAGEMLGLKMIFMDAGSGATKPVSSDMIKAVKEIITIPLIVGGGIRTAVKAIESCRAGADIIVVGNCIEDNPDLINELSDAVHSVQTVHSL
ncbi:MAG: geranylgeranylglyceryl/heptaprenylglyceryl phosphate synthase [Bacteroidia bacterium]|nr:geranylgeranylglyceryl/heptaprenylglyceryl phosphate synthase [Bacteroidia bacterium]